MKLIDMDHLIEHNKTFAGNVFITQSDIEKEPIIKAIPVEWIKQWVNKQYYIYEKEMYLKDMLEDWEEENEAN